MNSKSLRSVSLFAVAIVLLASTLTACGPTAAPTSTSGPINTANRHSTSGSAPAAQPTPAPPEASLYSQEATAASTATPAAAAADAAGGVTTPASAPEAQTPAQEKASPQQQPADQARLPQLNPFVPTSQDRLSTFAMDVDTGSYSEARNYLNAGQLPPPDTVRIEEFVNYFRYDYPPPQDAAFGIYVDSAPNPFGHESSENQNQEQGQRSEAARTHIVRVGIQGKRIEVAQRNSAVLTFVIDVSGSMQEQQRLPMVKQALRLLVNELRQGDEVGIVVYGSEARVLLDHTSAAGEEDKERILRAIDSLENEGSTNAEAGLRLGYELASKHFRQGVTNRVILCSDGVANVGATDPDGIRQSIRHYASQGLYLTTIGFGMGTYNDYLMEQLADDGDGSYAYVDTLDEARRIFVEKLTSTLQVIAKDAKIQVDFNPAVIARYRLLGYENRDVADQDFRNDRVDAGEVGAGHSVTALYEVELTGQGGEQGNDTALTVQVRYADTLDGKVREMTKRFGLSDFGSSLEQSSPHFQLALAAAGLAEQLHSGNPAQYPQTNTVLGLAGRAAVALPQDADAQELAQLVAKAASIR